MSNATYVRVWFRPRILRDVSNVDWSTTILGQTSSLPVYIVGHITSETLCHYLTYIHSPLLLSES